YPSITHLPSLHDALPIFTGDPAEQADGIVRCTLALLTRPIGASRTPQNLLSWRYVGFLRRLETAERQVFARALAGLLAGDRPRRSEEHTSELQSRENLVC